MNRFIARRASGTAVAEPKEHRSAAILFGIMVLVGVAVPFLVGKYWLSVGILALIYVLLGRYFIRGLLAGSLKG